VAFVGITRERFFEVLERNRNPAIWSRSAEGRWEVHGHLEDAEPVGAMT
jgi:hypothetical protein